MSSRRRLTHRLTDAFAAPADTHATAVPALFGGAGAAADHFRRIPIERIHVRADRPRRRIDPERLAELAESIRAHGVLQPIRLRAKGNGEYEIIAGERRWRAAQQAGLRQVPAVIATVDDGQAYAESLIENVQREDLNAVDRALALKRLRVNLGLQSWEEVGRVVGLTRQHVHNLLRISELPEVMQSDVRAGDLSEKHCRALLRLREDPDAQSALWQRIHDEQLSGDGAIAESKRVYRVRRDDDDVREVRDAVAMPPARARIGPAVDALLQVLAQAAPEEVVSARTELVELHALIADVLASSLASAAPAAIVPLPAGGDGGGDSWRSVLIPVAGQPAG